jgi:L-alanine-DL-glutamate epimerase-like enolase superfamily enzyme
VATTIAGAQAELWRYPLDPPMGAIATMDLVVTTLTASDGQTGMGFVPLPQGVDDLPLRAARAQLERFVAGRPLPHPVALWREISGSFRRTGHGPYYSGLASVDVAAWDLYAKSLGVPIGVAMGGTPRRVPVYASGGFSRDQDPAEAADVAARFLAAGARGVKVRAGGTPHDAKILRAVAERIAGRIDLMVDANERPTLSSAARLLRYAADAGARFVEEPLAVTEHAGFAALARTAPVPIATGENLRGSVAAAPYLLNRWCSVIQPDLASMGGLTECLRTAQIAEHCNVEVAPHFLPGLFVQLAAVAPHLTWLEDLPTVEALFSTIPRADPDGYFPAPTAPGHGLVLSDDARADFRIA